MTTGFPGSSGDVANMSRLHGYVSIDETVFLRVKSSGSESFAVKVWGKLGLIQAASAVRAWP
jgi:hypothetical protein